MWVEYGGRKSNSRGIKPQTAKRHFAKNKEIYTNHPTRIGKIKAGKKDRLEATKKIPLLKESTSRN